MWSEYGDHLYVELNSYVLATDVSLKHIVFVNNAINFKV